VAGDLAGQLGKIGFLVHREILYHAEPATALSPALLGALSQGHIAVALFFSPRTAECFIRLAQSQKIAEHCREIMALALSGNVATALAPLPWRTILIAEQPHQMAMMAALEGG
jgi:uroporphyrinogen-III synthase